LQKPFSTERLRENEKTGKLQKKCINKEMAEINHTCVFFFFFENFDIFLFFTRKKEKNWNI
jgi:hypothetical protein